MRKKMRKWKKVRKRQAAVMCSRVFCLVGWLAGLPTGSQRLSVHSNRESRLLVGLLASSSQPILEESPSVLWVN